MSAINNTVSRLSLAVSALVLAAGGIVHGLHFTNASNVVAHSDLKPFFATAFNALWLADSATSIVMAIVFAALAARPGWATRPLVVILALVPIVSAVVIYATMGAFFAGHVMLAAGAAALVGAAYKGSVTTKELRPSSI
jgi:hypothetical protein